MHLRRAFTALALAPLGLVAGCQCNDPGPVGGRCTLPRIAVLPLAYVHREFLIPVTIDGRATEFVIDTGAFNGATIFKDAADTLGMKQYRVEGAKVYGMSGESAVYYTHVSSFELGGVAKWQDLRMPTMQLVRTYTPEKPAGLLGDGLLKEFDVEFDIADKTFNIFSSDHCPGHVVYWKSDMNLTADFRLNGANHIEIPITVNGQAVTATLDSGAAFTAMTWGRANALGITKDTPGVRRAGKSGGIGRRDFDSWIYLLPKVVIGDETFTNLPILIFRRPDGPPNPFGSPEDLWLGADFFEKNRVYIAFKEHKIYFSPYKYKVAGGAASSAVGNLKEP